MKAVLNHIKLNAKDPGFYKELLEYLGFEIKMDFGVGFGASSDDVYIFVFKTHPDHQKQVNFLDTGLNHLAFRVETKEDVDQFYNDFLLAKNIPIMHEPMEYKEYNQGKGYYAVFFESPDHFKLEVLYEV